MSKIKYNSNLDLIKYVSKDIDVIVEYQGVARRLMIRNNKLCLSIEDKIDYVAFDSLEQCLKNFYWNGIRFKDLLDKLELISLQKKDVSS
ncbi:MAG: hypothetical protein ACK5G7_03130 [Erysipelotrichaceae bacterium]